MKNLITTLLFLIVVVFNANCQTYSKEFGRIGKDDIELTTYEKDKSAQAVVLFDIGRSRFVQETQGYNIIFEHQKRIKILSEAGIEYAEIEIPFYQEGNVYERIYDIEAATYNFENGQLKKSAITESDWHDEKVNEYWMVRKFAMPNIKKGSIIEFRYKISSQYLFNLRDWSFQSKIPTVYSEYKAELIPFYEYVWVLQGAKTFYKQKVFEDTGLPRSYSGIDFHDMVNLFAMKDIPAFKSEDFITSMNDYIIKIDFQLARIHFPTGGTRDIMSSWPKLIKELNKDIVFGKFINRCQKLTPKLIDTKSIEDKTDKDKFDFIINYVKQNFTWNENNGKYATKTPGALIKDKFGNSADLNLLAIGMLNAVGIETYPVLLSTRQNGKVLSDYPLINSFNYVAIYSRVDNKNRLSDATDNYTSNNRIPSKCINNKGLLVKEDEQIKWIGLQSNIPSIKFSDINIELEETQIKAAIKNSAIEYEATKLKKEIGHNKQNLIDYLENKNYQVEIENVSIDTTYGTDQKYKYDFSLAFKPEKINSKIYISPFLNETPKDNPLNQSTRSYPVDMIYPKRYISNSTISIPEGYEIDYLPKNYKIRNDLFELDYSVTQKEKEIKIVFSNYFKKAVYPAEYYAKVKFYLNEIVKKGNEKVVFKKSTVEP